MPQAKIWWQARCASCTSKLSSRVTETGLCRAIAWISTFCTAYSRRRSCLTDFSKAHKKCVCLKCHCTRDWLPNLPGTTKASSTVCKSIQRIVIGCNSPPHNSLLFCAGRELDPSFLFCRETFISLFLTICFDVFRRCMFLVQIIEEKLQKWGAPQINDHNTEAPVTHRPK